MQTTLESDRSIVRHRGGFRLTGQVSGDSVCSGPWQVVISTRLHGTSDFEVLADDVETTSGGAWSFALVGESSADYLARVENTSNCTGGSSPERTVKVRVAIAVTLPTPCRAPAKIKGSVLPRHDGTTVSLDRKVGKRWKRVDQAKLGSGSRFTMKAPDCNARYRVTWKSQSPRNESGKKIFKL
jgi:hypothetical protein